MLANSHPTGSTTPLYWTFYQDTWHMNQSQNKKAGIWLPLHFHFLRYKSQIGFYTDISFRPDFSLCITSCYLAFDIWQIFPSPGILSWNECDPYLSMQHFIQLRKTVQFIKIHQHLPFSFQSSTDGALVICSFMAAAHAQCSKQTAFN